MSGEGGKKNGEANKGGVKKKNCWWMMEATTTDVYLNRSPSAYNLLIFTHSQEKADEKDCVSYSIHEVGEGAAKVIKRLAQEEQRVKKRITFLYII